MGISIIATGKYLPEKIVTNDDFTKIVDTSDEWITTRTGIKKRHFATNMTTYQMGAKASLDAILKTNLTCDEIDMIIATTVTSDCITPSLSALVANEMEAVNAICIDINCACSGFVYALDMARRYLFDDDIHNVLIVSAEMLSKITDFTDRSTCVLFGDGAAACILEKSDKPFSCHLGADPTGALKLYAKGIPAKNPFMEGNILDDIIEGNGNYLCMDGREVYKFATKTMPFAVKKACEKAGITPEDLDLIIPHQANIRIVETAAKNLKLPIEKFYINLQDYGNTSSASIPICLDEVFEKNLVKKGDKICTVGFGAGLTYGAAVFEI